MTKRTNCFILLSSVSIVRGNHKLEQRFGGCDDQSSQQLQNQVIHRSEEVGQTMKDLPPLSNLGVGRFVCRREWNEERCG